MAIAIGTGAFADSLFTVDGIKVNSSGANAKQAKESATLSGEREAFSILLERIAADPKNSSLTGMDSGKISELVQVVEVNDEKVTASYYSATLSISFNKQLVEKLIKDSGINFTAKKNPPIILVPLLITGDQRLLFEEANPLRKSLAEVASANRAMNIIVPVNLRGVDKNKLNQNIEALPQDVKDSLLRLGQTYKASKLILIVAVQTGKDQLDIRLRDVQDDSGAIKELSFKNKDASEGEGVFNYAARGINSVLENQAVKGKNVSNDPLVQVILTAPFAGIEEWISIRRKLENMPDIKNINVKTLSAQYAILEISFIGSLDNFNSNMNEGGFYLENKGENLILRKQKANHSLNEHEDSRKYSYLNEAGNDHKG